MAAASPPWTHAQPLPARMRVIAVGSRGRGDAHPESNPDLAVPGEADAERLAGSRWHVMGAAAQPAGSQAGRGCAANRHP